MKQISITDGAATVELTYRELVMLSNSLADCAGAMESGEFESRVCATPGEADAFSDNLTDLVKQIDKKWMHPARPYC